MLTVGIDSGSQNTKAVLVKDGEIIGKAKIPTGFNANETAMQAYELALLDAGVKIGAAVAVVVTGAGRKAITFSNSSVNETTAAAKGIRHVNPEIRLVIDMGSEGCRAIKLKQDGKILNYEINDKCASGAGTFIESMARVLQIPIEEMGAYSTRHTKDVPMNAQCVVFAESEVVSLIHQKETVENIAYGIHIGIANRINSLVRRVGMTDHIAFIGGPGSNIGLVQCLHKELKKDLFIPKSPEYISALGAAVCAAESE